MGEKKGLFICLFLKHMHSIIFSMLGGGGKSGGEFRTNCLTVNPTFQHFNLTPAVKVHAVQPWNFFLLVVGVLKLHLCRRLCQIYHLLPCLPKAFTTSQDACFSSLLPVTHCQDWALSAPKLEAGQVDALTVVSAILFFSKCNWMLSFVWICFKSISGTSPTPPWLVWRSQQRLKTVRYLTSEKVIYIQRKLLAEILSCCSVQSKDVIFTFFVPVTHIELLSFISISILPSLL